MNLVRTSEPTHLLTGNDHMLPERLSDEAIRATGISFAAIAVAVFGAALSPHAPQHEILLWVLAVVPAFLLAYHRGWSGIATVLAAVMAALTAVHAGAGWLRVDMATTGPVLRILLVAIGTTAGVGALAELLQRARVRAERLELTDPETGLPNGRHASLVLEREHAGAVRGRDLILVAFQIDEITRHQLKNGRRGAGAVRRTFAGVLRKQTRRMNFSARDGDRFLTVLASGNADGAAAFVRRVQSAFAAAVGPGQILTVSAGIAPYDASMMEPAALVRAADFALFQAQQEGPGSVRVHQRRDKARQAEELLTSMRGLREKAL
jgi:diguanylate cyclase (GGDEF)-like protein